MKLIHLSFSSHRGSIFSHGVGLPGQASSCPAMTFEEGLRNATGRSRRSVSAARVAREDTELLEPIFQ